MSKKSTRGKGILQVMGTDNEERVFTIHILPGNTQISPERAAYDAFSIRETIFPHLPDSTIENLLWSQKIRLMRLKAKQ